MYFSVYLPESMYVYACMPAARGGHKRTADPLGLELGSCESAWVLRKRSSNAPKH